MRMRRRDIFFPAATRLFLLFILLATYLAAPRPATVAASTSPAAWSQVPLPAAAQAGHWALAPGTTLSCLTRAADNSIYGYGEGPVRAIFRSTDNGLSWTTVTTPADTVVALATSPADPAVLYYATADTVCRSADGGRSFITLQPGPGGSGQNNRRITSLAVTRAEGWAVAVGVADDDPGEYGGVWTMAEADGTYAWADTAAGPLDVLAVTFSPDYLIDRQLAAVATDETDTFVMFRSGNLPWNAVTTPATLHPDYSPVPVAAAAAALEFSPAAGPPAVYAGIDTGTGEGDLYRVTCGTGAATGLDLNAGSVAGLTSLDISTLGIAGSGAQITIIAGSANGTALYTSRDAGQTWSASLKDPPGTSVTSVLAAPDDAVPLLTATAGPGSGLSRSPDGGLTWGQTSFIDTALGVIVDLAPSPRFDTDGTLFLLTFGGGASSLWVSHDEGAHWERVLWTGTAGVTTLALVALPPDYGTTNHVVYTAGDGGGTPSVWLSRDDGRTFDRRTTTDPATSAPFPIDAWAVTGENTLLIAGYNGATSSIYRTDAAGLYYKAGSTIGSEPVASLAASGKSVLVGTSAGQVYLSNDDAVTFQQLPPALPTGLPSAPVSVAFDANYAANGAVYAAAAAPDSGVYRFRTDSSTGWEAIDTTLPAGGSVGQLLVSPEGLLYAIDNTADAGLERSLEPALSNPSFDTLDQGLSSGSVLYGLWQAANNLWSTDTTRNTLWRFDDTLTRPVRLELPADAATEQGTVTAQTVTGLRLAWEALPGAAGYEWQCSDGPTFSNLEPGLSGSTTGSSVNLPAIKPATTYYWRVRVVSPASSPWSDSHTFTTRLATQAASLQPESPVPGATDVPACPLFYWTGISDADAYELLVAEDMAFTVPVISRTGTASLPTNAWSCNISLSPGTTYYWKVRAVAGGIVSAWSATGIFTTVTLAQTPVPTVSPATAPKEPANTGPPGTTPTLQIFAPTTPATAVPSPTTAAPVISVTPTTLLYQPGTVPAWLLYAFGGLLVAVVLTLAVLFVVVLRIRGR